MYFLRFAFCSPAVFLTGGPDSSLHPMFPSALVSLHTSLLASPCRRTKAAPMPPAAGPYPHFSLFHTLGDSLTLLTV